MAFTNSGTHSTENKLLFLVYGAVVAKHIFLQKRIVYKSFFMNDKLILDNEKRKNIKPESGFSSEPRHFFWP